MTKSLVDEPCIKVKEPFREPISLTVAEYDDAVQASRGARTASTEAPGRRPWAEVSPPVVNLMRDPFKGEYGHRAQIVAYAPYHVQMRKLLGLD